VWVGDKAWCVGCFITDTRMQSSIESGLDALHQISQRKLGDILNKIPGKKDLIIDPVLLKPLECITGVSFLR
jgi:hypothetical protein